MPSKLFACAALVSVIASATACAQALDTRHTWYVQASAGDESSYALVLGATVPWKSSTWQLANGTLRGHWDVWLGGWSNQDLRDKRFTTPALGIGPSLRWRGAQGTAPWFLEIGTAVMVTGKRLYNNGERMGTRWNFASHLGWA